jgi:hypothetical protein
MFGAGRCSAMARSNLSELVSTERTVAAEEVELLHDMLAKHEEWSENGEKSYLIFIDPENCKQKDEKKPTCTQAVQFSGTCGANAPWVVFSHALRKRSLEHSTVNPRRLVCAFDAPFFGGVFVDGRGVDSRVVIEMMVKASNELGGLAAKVVEVDTRQFSTNFKYACEQLRENAVLVARMKVPDDFVGESASSTFQFAGPATFDKKIDPHAGAVVGVRLEGSELWFLLQNWWKGLRQWSEVSASYFQAMEPSLYSIRGELRDLKDCFGEISGDLAAFSLVGGDVYCHGDVY